MCSSWRFSDEYETPSVADSNASKEKDELHKRVI